MKDYLVSVMAGLLVLFVAMAANGATLSPEDEETGKQNEDNSIIMEEDHSMKALSERCLPIDLMDIAFGANSVFQASAGADGDTGSGEEEDGVSLTVNLELAFPIASSGLFLALFESGVGSGVDPEIPTFAGFNGDADDDENVRATELWYEHIWAEDRYRFRVGKIDVTSDFDTNMVANCEATQFLSGRFINNLAVEYPDDNGFGAMLWMYPGDTYALGIGLADADADWDNVLDNPFAIVEFDFSPMTETYPGNYRFYGWFNGNDHERLDDPASTEEDNYGFGISFDQQVTGSITLFTRYGWQRGNVSQIEHSWSAGLQCSGEFLGREDDTIGLAYGLAVIGSDWEDAYADDGIDFGNEHHLELYYNYSINEYLGITPDIQWVKNPEGDKDRSDVWMFGVRAQLSF